MFYYFIICGALSNTMKSFSPNPDLRFVEECYRSDGLESSIVCPFGIDSAANPVKFIYLKEIEHSLWSVHTCKFVNYCERLKF